MSDRADDFRIVPSPSGRLLCGGCAPDGRCRLGVEPAEADEDAMTFDVVCPRHWHGGPEVAHGGWTAAVFDDVLNIVALRREARLVTKSLHVVYHRPVPVERPLKATARIDSHADRRWEVSARLTLAGDTVALAAASAELRTRRPDHFARHQAWLAHE
ncbi:PaaI family thioesterase [Amycolatopsis sp. WGS_07]|uniref:PaaI family thioesterase n=1 Tax=Amycolatopsis sp. WGS_07 TaxID=3076764 RepID=UPI00387315C7